MSISSWLCTNSTKKMLVKIVHPGGHVELHDRPVLASDIMLRNPRCCVAHPHVFQQPWAILSPDTTLMLGQKFYVVPISTIRKLQRLSSKYSSSSETSTSSSSSSNSQSCKDHETAEGHDQDESTAANCWLFMDKNAPKFPYACLKHSGDEEGHQPNKGLNSNTTTTTTTNNNDNSCCVCFITSFKIKSNSGDQGIRNEEDTKSSSSNMGSPSPSSSSSEAGKRKKDFVRKGLRGSPKSHIHNSNNWHPSLYSICEE